MLQEELADDLPRLVILVAEDVLVPAGGRNTSVPVRPESILLDSRFVLAPPLLHGVVHLQVGHNDDHGHLAVAKHVHEQVIRLLHRDGDPSTLHAKHEEIDTARLLQSGNERVRLVDGIQVLGLLHLALSLVQTGCVVQGKLDAVEGDDVLLRLERAALGTTRGSGYVSAGDEIDEGALSHADVSNNQDVAADGPLGGGGTRTSAIRPHGSRQMSEDGRVDGRYDGSRMMGIRHVEVEVWGTWTFTGHDLYKGDMRTMSSPRVREQWLRCELLRLEKNRYRASMSVYLGRTFIVTSFMVKVSLSRLTGRVVLDAAHEY